MSISQRTNSSGKPPFLFRVASDESRGFNSTDEIDPPHGYNAQYHSDLASIPFDKTGQMVYDHLTSRFEAPSEVSSWSISLLEVLVRAVYKAHGKGEAEVLIYLMDTNALPASNGLYKSEDLVREYKVGWAKDILEFAKGEYLIHGKLHHTEGLWKAVDFNDLLAAGLGDAFLRLTNQSYVDQMFQRIKVLRMAYFRGPATPLSTYLPVFRKPARCFGPTWEGAVIIALVTSRKRDLSEDSADGLFSELQSHGTLLPQSSWCSDVSPRVFECVNRDVKEGVQFVKLLYLLHRRGTAHAAIARAAVTKPVQKPTVRHDVLLEGQESDCETSAKKRLRLACIRVIES
ncbi:hypothetical protein LTR37_015534 [Vermiconidia calcicola]|uniref:Uncharacterized protein n=1 Tax=Vermiconidia calcicola TaxID=1690605 RepID=A0ACC3MQD5_9PEZI|nr:hypothetical protein LTR37_015534 [Vermiconidia calcicola]